MNDISARWQELFWALPPGHLRSKLRALEMDMGNALRAERDFCVVAMERIDALRRPDPHPATEDLTWNGAINAALNAVQAIRGDA